MSGLILHLSISQSHVFLINSRLGLFTAATRKWRPFSRSYRAILPSSLAMNHSSTLGCSPRLPVSDYGTGCLFISLEVFLGSLIRYTRITRRFTVLSGSSRSADLPTVPITTPFNALFRQCADRSLLRHPIAILTGTGILTCFPSRSPFGLPLGPD